VKSVGIGVSSWRVGDTAAALLEGGGYAQYATARESQLFPIPRGVSVVEAAGLPEATCTAWTNLVDTGGLRAGDTVLIHGGSGGVGTIAVQLAKALGAFVIATAGGPQRVAAVGQLGADIVIDHRSDDVIAAVRAATDGRGADVILDILGAGGLGANVRALAPGGRLVIIGLQQGRHGELDVGALLAKRATIAGTTLRARTPAEKAALVAMVRERVWPLIEAGQVRPIIDSVLPLAAANDALDRLATGGVFGKLLLAI
jgi:putative PIG3 family NAD(P)H quinone oxidoreductase